MAEYKDILGNKRVVADETVTISLARYNQLIIKEALTDTNEKCEKPKTATFIIKGNCVDDLFHILNNNGDPTQISTMQDDTNTFRVDVILKESEEK